MNSQAATASPQKELPATTPTRTLARNPSAPAEAEAPQPMVSAVITLADTTGAGAVAEEAREDSDVEETRRTCDNLDRQAPWPIVALFPAGPPQRQNKRSASRGGGCRQGRFTEKLSAAVQAQPPHVKGFQPKTTKNRIAMPAECWLQISIFLVAGAYVRPIKRPGGAATALQELLQKPVTPV